MSTIYDVAKIAGVSPATVSRVINKKKVSTALAARVWEAVAELQYRPNSVARNLRRQSTRVWALVLSDIENPFFTSVIRGVEDVAQSEGYSVVLCNSDEDLEREARYIQVILDEQMAGAIVSPTSEHETDLTPFTERDFPVVTVDRGVSGVMVDAVLVDNRHGAELATRHLIDAGCRRIACITGPQQTTTGTQRLEGYKRALAPTGREAEPELVRIADFKEQGAYVAARSLLALPEPPDGIFVANNLMMLGTIRALRDENRSMPRLAGFDDMPWADLIEPAGLTTVAQPAYEMGQQAASLLLERIRGTAGSTRQVLLMPTLRVRANA